MKSQRTIKHECHNLAAYWIARFLSYSPEIASETSMEDLERFLPVLGKELEENTMEVDEILLGFNRKSSACRIVYRCARRQTDTLRKRAWNIDPRFLEKLETICKIFSLGDNDKKLLVFALLYSTCEPFQSIVDCLDLSPGARIKVLAHVLEMEQGTVRDFLAGRSELHSAGLVSGKTWGPSSMTMDFELLDGLSSFMFFDQAGIDQALFSHCFKRVKAPALERGDFSHVKQYDILVALLSASTRRRARGTNVLIYGPPGTGKTELARFLEREGLEVFQIPFNGKEGEPLGESARLGNYRLAQRMLRNNSRAVILMDDADMILESALSFWSVFLGGADSDAFTGGGINRLLEENTVPAIWICNETEGLSRARQRRFALSIRIDRLPRKAREKVVQKHMTDLGLDPAWLDMLASKNLSPGIIARSSDTLRLAGVKGPGDDSLEAAELVLNSALDLGGRPPIRFSRRGPSLPFLADALNSSWNAGSLRRALERSGRGRLLFFGAPGTGKTELARQLASMLDRELLVKTASDLLDPFLGETEKNIAGMFRQAEGRDTLLLVDEADSLVRKRQVARHSWEVTMVNEFLSRMEAFDGILICATNYETSLDPAAMRRFDFKVEFRPMLPEQAWMLFSSIFPGADPEKTRKRLDLMTLTPGNFATVLRRLSMLTDNIDPEMFLRELREEAAAMEEQDDWAA